MSDPAFLVKCPIKIRWKLNYGFCTVIVLVRPLMKACEQFKSGSTASMFREMKHCFGVHFCHHKMNAGDWLSHQSTSTAGLQDNLASTSQWADRPGKERTICFQNGSSLSVNGNHICTSLQVELWSTVHFNLLTKPHRYRAKARIFRLFVVSRSFGYFLLLLVP